MGWWPEGWSKQARLWSYVQQPKGHGLEAKPDEHYIAGTLRSVLPGRVRKGLKRYYGVVHAATTVGDLNEGSVEFQRVVLPASLRDVDEATIANATQLASPLLGPVPYRGGTVDLQIGLFSIRSADLTGPFLDVLLDVANAATVAFIPVAQPLATVVIRGMQGLTDSNGGMSSLEMGLSRSFAAPASSDHILVKATSGEVELSGWTVGQDDFVRNDTGTIPTSHPWLAFSFEVATERGDWYSIPVLREAHAQVRTAIKNGRQDEARWSLEALRLRALACPDLLPKDALTLYGKVKELVKQAFPGGPVAGHQHDIGALEDIDLYA